MAAHLGVKRALLIGYDMREVDGASHWHGMRKKADGNDMRSGGDVYAKAMLPRFPTLVEPLRRRGVEVINCTPGSALDVWPMGELNDVI